MYLDFIEIGTSDFDTLIQTDDYKKGLSIEPIKYYIDRLPNKEQVIKINCAISDKEGSCEIYYITEENINKYNLPNWVRGCNSINHYHPTVTKLCKKINKEIEEISTHYKVETKTLYNIFKQYNIEFCYYLKIDTEGHDVIILNKFYEDLINNYNINYYPHKILFESNILTDNEKVIDIIDKYNMIGYDLIEKKGDTIMKLNLNKIKNKNKFVEIENYMTDEKIKDFDTLIEAQEYCCFNNYNCVTLENNKYSVFNGKYLEKKEKNYITWIYL